MGLERDMARTVGSKDLKPRKPRADCGIRRRDANAEARIQAAIVAWVRTVAPDLLIFSIPNEGLRTKAQIARLIWMGLRPGVWDLCVIGDHGQAYVMETKTDEGRLSKEQREIEDEYLLPLRVPHAVVRSIDDARRAFAVWGIKTREH